MKVSEYSFALRFLKEFRFLKKLRDMGDLSSSALRILLAMTR